MTWRRVEDEILNPSPGLVIFAALVFIADEALFQWLGPKNTGLKGVFDWTDHLITTLLIVWALFPGLRRIQVVPVLLASILIDLDHVPGFLGSHILTGSDPRPYTHSLATVVVLLLVAVSWRRNRLIFLALALGIASHLWRDLAEPVGSAVTLFWPVSHEAVHLNPVFYFGSIGIFAVIALARTLRPSRSRLESELVHA